MSQLDQEKQRIVNELLTTLRYGIDAAGDVSEIVWSTQLTDALDALHAAVVREVESKGIEVLGLKVERGDLWIALPHAAEKIKKFFVIDAESLAPNKDKEE